MRAGVQPASRVPAAEDVQGGQLDFPLTLVAAAGRQNVAGGGETELDPVRHQPAFALLGRGHHDNRSVVRCEARAAARLLPVGDGDEGRLFPFLLLEFGQLGGGNPPGRFSAFRIGPHLHQRLIFHQKIHQLLPAPKRPLNGEGFVRRGGGQCREPFSLHFLPQKGLVILLAAAAAGRFALRHALKMGAGRRKLAPYLSGFGLERIRRGIGRAGSLQLERFPQKEPGEDQKSKANAFFRTHS